MANNKSRLTPVVTIAEVREKDAARELSQKMKLREQILEQLQQLRRYCDEYKQNSLVGKHHTPETFVDMQVFLSRLNKSIEGMERQLQIVEQQLDELNENWQKSKIWTRSLEKAVERDLSRLENIRHRREQKEHDEIASRTGDQSSATNR